MQSAIGADSHSALAVRSAGMRYGTYGAHTGQRNCA